MAAKLLARLTDQHLVFPVGPIVFTGLVAETLGVAATPADGFEAMHAAVMREIPHDEAIGLQLGEHAAAADFHDGAVRSGQVVPLAHDIEAFNSTIEPDSKALGTIISKTPEGIPAGAIIAPGECPKGTVYNPWWQLFGWKTPCGVPKK
jgi:hypothetical protein